MYMRSLILIILDQKPLADALNNIDRLFLRIPPSVEMVDISSSFIEGGEEKRCKIHSEIIRYGC